MCEFFKIFDVVIEGSLLGSNDHCYVLLNVPDHFWVKSLLCSYTFLSDQNSSLHQICQSFCVPQIIRSLTGSSGALCSDGSRTRRMIRPYTGSSGPGRPLIYRPAPAPAPLSLFFLSSTAAASCFFHSMRGDLAIWPWVFAAGGLFGFPSLRRLRSPPSLLWNFLICAANSKVTHSKLPSLDLSM